MVIIEKNKKTGEIKFLNEKSLHTKEEAEIEFIRIFESRVKRYRNMYDVSYSLNFELKIEYGIH